MLTCLRLQLVSHVINLLEVGSIITSELYPVAMGGRVLTIPGEIRITQEYVISVILMTAALAIRLACYRELGRHFTFELSLKKDHKLVTSGPYSVVRHPSYTACILQFAAMLVAQLGPGSWWYEKECWRSPIGQISALGWTWFIGATVLFFFRRAKQEDQMLQTEFHEKWVEWAHRTPYKFVPYIW